MNCCREMLETMRADWILERLDEETRIKEEYAREAQMISKFLAILFFTGYILFTIAFMFGSKILDVIIPLNESRPNILILQAEYFVDEQKYFYSIVTISTIVEGLALVSAMSLQLIIWVFFHHLFGMFGVIGYGLENALPYEQRRSKEGCIHNDNIYYESIIIYVERYKSAIKFFKTLQNYMQFPFAVGLLFSTVILIPTLLSLTDTKHLECKTLMQSGVLLGYIFINTYFGQKLIDLSSEIDQKIYFSDWRYCSLSIQKLLPFMIRQSDRPCMISIQKFYVLSIDCFRMVITTAFSWFTVFRNIT
ncbi:odorant receptor 13a-like [Prorops nasuta]|uniref:odorant receptor 13a-like n=1 Tax=Prorops nasuta TaxID=863751 RepID=UPI0034CF9F6B